MAHPWPEPVRLDFPLFPQPKFTFMQCYSMRHSTRTKPKKRKKEKKTNRSAVFCPMTITSQTGLSLSSTVNASYRPLWHFTITRQEQTQVPLYRCILIKDQYHLRSLHCAESMFYACSLGLGYPTPNFQWPMIPFSLVLFESVMFQFVLSLLVLRTSSSITKSWLVPVCSYSYFTYILFYSQFLFCLNVLFCSHIQLGQCFQFQFSSDDKMFVSYHLRLARCFLCSVYIHVNQAS